MTAGISVVKRTSNVFRKLTNVRDVAEIYKDAAYRHKKNLIGVLKKNIEHAKNTELQRKLEVAKGYYQLEMAPPTSREDITRLRSDIQLLVEFMKSGCFKQLTVKQAWLLFLVGTEVALWFFLGETIGKMHIVGYKV